MHADVIPDDNKSSEEKNMLPAHSGIVDELPMGSKLDDYSLEVLDVVIQKPASMPNGSMNSWLYDQFAQQIQLMVSEQLTNGEKTQQMEFKLKDRIARLVHVIKASDDGNCLFTSLAHQLWPVSMNSKESKQNAKRLRAAVVEYILHSNDFSSFQMAIEDRLTESDNDASSLENKCKMWVRHVLSRPKIWGGLETIKAVSCMHTVNMAVFNECGIVHIIKGSNETYNRTILIAYRLAETSDHKFVYNHYDSVCDMDSDSIYAASEFIINLNMH